MNSGREEITFGLFDNSVTSDSLKNKVSKPPTGKEAVWKKPALRKTSSG